MLGSKLPLFSYGMDGHQPYSRCLYAPYKGSRAKVGMTIPNIRRFDGTYSDTVPKHQFDAAPPSERHPAEWLVELSKEKRHIYIYILYDICNMYIYIYIFFFFF